VILEGEAETGISVMRVEKEMDAGAVALTRRIAIEPMENTEELSARLARLAADAIGEALDQIAGDRITWTEQDATRASFAAKLEKQDAELDLRQAAHALAARIHAVSPRPGGAVHLQRENEITTLKISRARVEPASPDEARCEPGSIQLGSGPDEAPLRIATGEGWLVPQVIQRPGGRPLPIAEFLRGFPIQQNERLGPKGPVGEAGQNPKEGREA
jgi:methionyl-tRNA formyltransferase